MNHVMICLCLAWSLATVPASALAQQPARDMPAQAVDNAAPLKGISFRVLRVIYAESARDKGTLTVDNDTAAPYLMQSWVRPVDPQTGGVDSTWSGEPEMPFIITPPLARLEPFSSLTVRLRRTNQPLPPDRESVFFISMRALPAQEAPQRKDQLVMTVVSNLKLFYRPAGLAEKAIVDAAPQLTFRREGSTLVAVNPTPYWLTFSQLKVGQLEFDKPALRLMVPPKGEQRFHLASDPLKGAVVAWKLIDEDGWNTAEIQQALL
ncbi:fimbrial biogenesis chaperone [Serratia fonticola]